MTNSGSGKLFELNDNILDLSLFLQNALTFEQKSNFEYIKEYVETKMNNQDEKKKEIFLEKLKNQIEEQKHKFKILTFFNDENDDDEIFQICKKEIKNILEPNIHLISSLKNDHSMSHVCEFMEIESKKRSMNMFQDIPKKFAAFNNDEKFNVEELFDDDLKPYYKFINKIPELEISQQLLYVAGVLAINPLLELCGLKFAAMFKFMKIENVKTLLKIPVNYKNSIREKIEKLASQYGY